MRTADILGYAWCALATQRVRSILTLLAMGLGAASVVLLIALGEGARAYVRDQFAQLGTHLLIVLPGRNETRGGPPPLLGETARDLTLDDARALGRLPTVATLAPLTLGSAPVSYGAREREVMVLGSTSALLPVRHLKLAQGHFLPVDDPERATSVAVLGQKLARELFGHQRALGEWVRIGDRRFRVIGLLASQGQSLGQDLGDMVVIPVASAQALFNAPGLFRILIQAKGPDALEPTRSAVQALIKARHEGEDDVTLITQDALLSTFDRILGALTLAVGGIGAISLSVAGVLIMNVMLVAVSQRTAEIGLLKALGAVREQIGLLFLTEALLLALGGTGAGIALALLVVGWFNASVSAFQLLVPNWSLGAAIGVAMATGLVFGLVPALRASRLDPVQAFAEG